MSPGENEPMKTQIVTRVTTPITRRGVLESMYWPPAPRRGLCPAVRWGWTGSLLPPTQSPWASWAWAIGAGRTWANFSSRTWRVVAICDVNQRHIALARDRIAKDYGLPIVKVLTDFRRLNADPAIDAV